LLYNLGNNTALDIIEKLLALDKIGVKKIAIYLLFKPLTTITKLSVKERELAKGLLGFAAKIHQGTELGELAQSILAKYYKDAWVGW
jgi:hypothetical protein